MTKPILVNPPFFHLFWVWGDEIELGGLNTLYLIPSPQFRPKRVFLSKLDWSRDVTGKVDKIHSNLTRGDMVKKMFPIFFDYFNIEYFLKKLWGFLFELIDFVLDESAVGERTVTFVLFQFLEIGAKHARRCREPTMTS